ncbi:hypothetical protein ISX56_33040, partial [Serratia ureilytica]|nr:hypothetical protein [Serratia ureilytica]
IGRQGNIIFVGRRDHQVKIRGVRIEMGEVESAVRSHPLVESACVVARSQPSGKILAAFIAPFFNTALLTQLDTLLNTFLFKLLCDGHQFLLMLRNPQGQFREQMLAHPPIHRPWII